MVLGRDNCHPAEKARKKGTIPQESAYYPLDALLEMAPEREPMTEDEAVLSCQKGDKDAFHYLVDLYKDVVFGTAYMMTGNRSLAEEQMQEAFWRLGWGSRDSKQVALSNRGWCAYW